MEEYAESLTVKQLAPLRGYSERSAYYLRTVFRHSAEDVDWLSVLGNIRPGRTLRAPNKVGLRWVATVCKRYSRHLHGGTEMQRLLFIMLKEKGTEHTQLWLKLFENDPTFLDRNGLDIPNWMLIEMGKRHLVNNDDD